MSDFEHMQPNEYFDIIGCRLVIDRFIKENVCTMSQVREDKVRGIFSKVLRDCDFSPYYKVIMNEYAIEKKLSLDKVMTYLYDYIDELYRQKMMECEESYSVLVEIRSIFDLNDFLKLLKDKEYTWKMFMYGDYFVIDTRTVKESDVLLNMVKCSGIHFCEQKSPIEYLEMLSGTDVS